jgi:hypothetical protein
MPSDSLKQNKPSSGLVGGEFIGEPGCFSYFFEMFFLLGFCGFVGKEL